MTARRWQVGVVMAGLARDPRAATRQGAAAGPGPSARCTHPQDLPPHPGCICASEVLSQRWSSGFAAGAAKGGGADTCAARAPKALSGECLGLPQQGVFVRAEAAGDLYWEPCWRVPDGSVAIYNRQHDQAANTVRASWRLTAWKPRSC